MKIILNKCYGGYSFSDAAIRLYAEMKGFDLCIYNYEDRKKAQARHELRTFYTSKDFGESISDEAWDSNEFEDAVIDIRDDRFRTDAVMIDVVQKLGAAANGSSANLQIVDIPDDLDYVIEDYDGFETLHERVMVW